MSCEVNVKPPNDASMQFHLARGFRQVGTLSHDNGRKQVALLVLEPT
jgi:predicted GNAT superfamily acetyltransferase